MSQYGIIMPQAPAHFTHPRLRTFTLAPSKPLECKHVHWQTISLASLLPFITHSRSTPSTPQLLQSLGTGCQLDIDNGLPVGYRHIEIRTAQDAHRIFEAVRLNLLPLIRRRLSPSERDLLASGQVFVWEEAPTGSAAGDETSQTTSGLERWTDGRRWWVVFASVLPFFFLSRIPYDHPLMSFTTFTTSPVGPNHGWENHSSFTRKRFRQHLRNAKPRRIEGHVNKIPNPVPPNSPLKI